MKDTRRARAVLALALASTASLLATQAGAAAPSHAATTPKGMSIVQYAMGTTGATPSWGAHLLSPSPALTTATGPRVAPDASGGLQVAYRNAQGHVIWLEGDTIGEFHHVDLTKVVAGLGTTAGVPVPFVSPSGADTVAIVGSDGDLKLATWVPDLPQLLGTDPRENPYSLWQFTNLTEGTGPRLAGTPSVVVEGSQVAVFARTAGGDLVEYVNDPLGLDGWRAYDLTIESGGPTILGDPAAFYDASMGSVRVAAVELAPTPGDVIVYTPNDVGGRIWSVSDVTEATDGAPGGGGVAAVMEGTTPLLFSSGPTGDLLEYTGTDSGTTTAWQVSDLTTSVAGAPTVAGTPAVAVAGQDLVVAAAAEGWGDLFVWQQPTAGAPFSATDVSLDGRGPARTVAGSPAAAFDQGTLSLFGAGTGVPAPEGTGVYAIPNADLSRAIEDGWPSIGVTGGLGAQCAPWVGYATPDTDGVVEPDEQLGQVIQASHVRETWLSFWTVSGPGTPAGTGCTDEKAPYSASDYYAHGYLAGAWVATQIDAYSAAGVAIKPDWVIFDPEGYPDNHSGLWGPTAPQAALQKSVADYAAILSGWKAGLDSVDPSLKAALYANQYEYMTYELYNQPLPTFIAGAFAQQTVGGKHELVVPTRSAFGANIRGFVMFNENFTPTCTQLDDEAQLLTEAPWNGEYNTIQTTGGVYCPPAPTS